MAKKDKKIIIDVDANEITEVPENETMSSALQRKLLKSRDSIIRKKDALKEKASSELGDVGFWTVAGGVAFFALDWTVAGGICTLIAGASGIGWAHYTNQSNKAEKELDKTDEKLLELDRQEGARNQRLLERQLKGEFDKAASVSAEDLQQQIAKLQSQLDQLQNPPETNLRKPKFNQG